MIIKKISAERGGSKAAYVYTLTSYILQPQNKNRREKLLYSGFSGFICTDTASCQTEMAALASESARCKNPVVHWLMSWKEGEQPSETQIQVAVKMLLAELGLDDCQCLWGAHQDTENVHCHISINRMHPLTSKVIIPNGGFDLEAGHRAIAKIEHDQGWEREINGLFRIGSNGELIRCRPRSESARQPSGRALDYEHRTGAKSVQRVATETVATLIAKAASWQEVHQVLRAQGIRYQKKGSGAVIVMNGVAIKAGDAGRVCSLTQLQKRLGTYQESDAGPILNTPMATQPLKPNAPGWSAYIQQRQQFFADRDHERNLLRSAQDAQRKGLFDRHRRERQEFFESERSTLQVARQAQRSMLAAAHAAAKAELMAQIKLERDRLKKRFPSFPDFEAWLRQDQQRPDLADAWRYRDSTHPTLSGIPNGKPVISDIRSFRATVVGKQVYFSQEGAPDTRTVAFIDRGREITVCDHQDRASILAALQLGAQKWRCLEVTGNDDFKRICIELAAEHNIQFSDIDMQLKVDAAKKKMRADRRTLAKSPQMRELLGYMRAMQAPHYDIAASTTRSHATREIQKLRLTPPAAGVAADDVLVRHVSAMLNWERDGHRLTISPVWDDKVALVLSGVNQAEKDQILLAGFSPRAILETTTGRFDLVLTVPVLSTPYSKEMIITWARLMAKEFGVAGHVATRTGHPVPGFENRLTGLLGADGAHHKVKLTSTSRTDCEKTFQILKKIAAENSIDMTAESTNSNGSFHVKGVYGAALPAVSDYDALAAYRLHHAELTATHVPGRMDRSRIDAAIALRMRMTGHSAPDMTSALLECAHLVGDQDEQRNWAVYAKRVVDFAWGPAGDRLGKTLMHHRQQWQQMERPAGRQALYRH